MRFGVARTETLGASAPSGRTAFGRLAQVVFEGVERAEELVADPLELRKVRC
jgi:hypothetical protein